MWRNHKKVKRIYVKYATHVEYILSKARKLYYNLNPFISIGKGTYIESGVQIKPVCKWGIGSVHIGENCFIGRDVILLPQGGNIVIGSNTSINPRSIIYGMGGLTIGNDVRIGPRCMIIPQNHNYIHRDIVINQQGMTSKGVEIGNDIWVGANVTILDGVHINDGCVLGGGCVVTHDTKEYGVYVGVPAKLIKMRE